MPRAAPSLAARAEARALGVAQGALGAWGWEGAALSVLDVSENVTFLVERTSGEQAVLRVHRPGYHDAVAVASELAWLSALRHPVAGVGMVRVPEVIAALSGPLVVEGADPLGGPPRCCVLFAVAPGEEPARRDPALFEALGRLTARLHDHAQAWNRPPWFRRFTWDADAAFGGRARWGRWQDAPGVGPKERALLGAAELAVARRLAEFGRDPGRFGLIHADLRMANLLIEGGTVASEAMTVTVIDFDDCGFGWHLYDLAGALSFFEDAPDVPELIDRWLIGYRQVRPLPQGDEGEVGTFLVFRRLLLLAWVGSHPEASTAVNLRGGFAARTCEMAESYLRRAR